MAGHVRTRPVTDATGFVEIIATFAGNVSET
jgi:hypothetical protein